MPAMSPTMESGGLSRWQVKEGDKFAAGDVLLQVETDKASMDVEAQDDGVLAKIIVRSHRCNLADRADRRWNERRAGRQDDRGAGGGGR